MTATGGRLPRVGPDGWGPELEQVFVRLAAHPRAGSRTREDPGELFAHLANNPRLFAAWMSFTTALHAVQTLEDRHRELLVLRTGWLCRAPYEWGQHVAMGHAAGLTTDDVEAVVEGAGSAHWDELDSAFVRVVDELHHDGSISDPTWERLAARCTPAQLVEIPMLVGWYHLVAFVQNALRVPLEANAGGLESR